MASLSANIIVTCKSRMDFLRKTLSTMVAQEYPGRWWVTVVDYDDPEGSAAYCQLMNFKHLRAVKVVETDGEFRLGHARNVGAVRSYADVLCFVDADCLLSPKWLESIVSSVQEGCQIVLPVSLDADISGTCAFLASLFHSCRGYDESFRGWGWDDTDMYKRTTVRGGKIGRFDNSLIEMLHHDNDLRVTNYDQKDPWKSHLYNVSKANDPAHGLTNPLGYGIARCVCWWPEDACTVPIVSP